jgi:hypothetical protein
MLRLTSTFVLECSVDMLTDPDFTLYIQERPLPNLYCTIVPHPTRRPDPVASCGPSSCLGMVQAVVVPEHRAEKFPTDP